MEDFGLEDEDEEDVAGWDKAAGALTVFLPTALLIGLFAIVAALAPDPGQAWLPP